MARWHSANVLEVGPETRRVWQFTPAGNGEFHFEREFTYAEEGSAPRQLAKDWKALWQKKLNIAWIPSDKVYLRVLHLPAVDRAETISMVELQLEKVSPLPVAQIAWTLETLPATKEGTQTVIVVIVPRSLVEEFLGQLEGQGYLADRLEVPILDQLFATKAEDDGVWIFPGATNEHSYLLAWWYGGILQNISVLNLPDGISQASELKNQVEQMAWAGELDGWLTSPPKFHLVADPIKAAEWEAVIRTWTDEPIQVIPAADPVKLAALSTQRAATADGKVGLLPGEYAIKYRQRFIDSLWMRALAAILVIYVLWVGYNIARLQIVKYQHRQVQKQLGALSLSYTNALKMEARIQVLVNRQNLRYAALDCWRAVAELLPPEVKVEQIVFGRGKTFEIIGTVAPDQEAQVATFNDAMRRYTLNDRQVFSKVGTPSLTSRANVTSWRFNCELKSPDGP